MPNQHDASRAEPAQEPNPAVLLGMEASSQTRSRKILKKLQIKAAAKDQAKNAMMKKALKKMQKTVANKVDMKVVGPGMQRVPRKLRAPRVVRVGTDFSGMETPVHAMQDRMALHIKHVFSSDVDPAVGKLIKHQFKPEQFHSDIAQRTEAEEQNVDAYIWGAPCPSWSSAGQQRGLDDPRGRLIAIPLQYISRKRPRLTIMENVKGMTTKRFRPVLRGICETLQRNGYNVNARVLNSKSYGVAQDRDRVYVVAIRADSQVTPFKWPEPTSGTMPSLETILDVVPSDVPGRLPKIHRSKLLAKAAFGDALKHGINALEVPVAVDIDCSTKFGTYGIDIARTLTKARGGTGGPWISTKGRRTTIDELFRVQGFNPADYQWREAGVTERQMGMMLGNSMSLPVVGHVLAEALWAAGLTSHKPVFAPSHLA